VSAPELVYIQTGIGLAPIYYPGGNRPEGYGQTNFFAEYRPGWDKLKRSARRPQRRERGR
jgi:hypothetical protein